MDFQPRRKTEIKRVSEDVTDIHERIVRGSPAVSVSQL